MSLSLSVSTGDQQEYQFLNHHTEVIKQAGYTCTYCGFTSVPCPNKNATALELQGYMHVHSRSYSLASTDSADLDCVCPFCYQVLNLTTVAKPIFIYFPWCSQEQLNHLLLVVFSVIRNGTDEYLSDQATKLYLKLIGYKNYVDQIIPSLNHHPNKLIQGLYWLANEDLPTYLERDKALHGLRLIGTEPPKCEGFQMHFSYWNTYKWYQENLRDAWRTIHSEHIDFIKKVA